MPYPYRQNRCWCRKEGVFSYGGETYCFEHIPYQEMASELTIQLATIIGKEAKDKLIDEWFPYGTFTWKELYAKTDYLVSWLNVPTGLLALDS